MSDTKTTTGGLNFTYPIKGAVDFTVTFEPLWARISAHDHTGSDKGLPLDADGLESLSVTTAKLNIINDTFIDALDFATTGRVNMLKVNASDLVEAGTAVVMPHLILTDGVTAPTSTSGQAQIYVDTADGDLKIRFGDGFTATIQTDS